MNVQSTVISLLLAFSLLTIGCINTPDALELQLAPAREVFECGDPILINATLKATNGPICLHNADDFQVELRRTDDEKQFKSSPVAYCGTSLIGLLPLYPILLSITLLDVADVINRYIILEKDQEQTYQLQIIPKGSDRLWVYSDKGNFHANSIIESVPLPSGRYNLRVNYASLKSSYPAPLFWKPYNHPIAAETELVIKDK